MARFVIALIILSLGGCRGSDHDSDSGDDGTIPEEPDASVQIGLPSTEDDLEFQVLEPGSEVRLQTFGQGGTHVLIGVRCTGFGNRAFVSIAVQNLHTGAVVRTPAPVRPQLLFCQDGACDLVPLLAMTSGLTEPGEDRNGLPIEISASVKNDAGVEASASTEAVLSTADL